MDSAAALLGACLGSLTLHSHWAKNGSFARHSPEGLLGEGRGQTGEVTRAPRPLEQSL